MGRIALKLTAPADQGDPMANFDLDLLAQARFADSGLPPDQQ